jgi:hypothetical protein
MEGNAPMLGNAVAVVWHKLYAVDTFDGCYWDFDVGSAWAGCVCIHRTCKKINLIKWGVVKIRAHRRVCIVYSLTLHDPIPI